MDIIFTERLWHNIFSFIHLQHLLYDCPIILQTGDFVLTADAALAAEPILKEIFAGESDFGSGERKILVTLGVVVGIEAAQLKIQRICKRLQVVGLHIKFYQPLMTTALVGLHIDRCGGVVADVGTGGVARAADGAGSIVLHKLLAKSVDEMH